MTVSDQREEYIATKVLTAPPHKRHLMLIEGAIRFGRQAQAAMERDAIDAAAEPLMRTLEVVGEMLVAVRESKTELNQKLAELYLFLFRCVSEAKINDDTAKLADALRVLEFERETWQLVCQKLEADPEVDAKLSEYNAESERATPPLPLQQDASWSATANSGLSLEA